MPEKDYRVLENKARRQHYVSILIERLSGKTVEQIALALEMEVPSVDRDLEYVRRNWSRIFVSNVEQSERKSLSQPAVRMWRTKAICCACGADIPAGAERVLVAALELTNQIEVGVSEEVFGFDDIGVASSRFIHCCETCSPETVDFKIANPAFVDKERLASLRGESEELRQVNEKRLGEALASPEVQPVPGSQQSGEDAQKALLDRFLSDPRSRGMRPEMRTAAKMWVNGTNQKDIALKLGKDQATVSRMIAGARQMAYARA